MTEAAERGVWLRRRHSPLEELDQNLWIRLNFKLVLTLFRTFSTDHFKKN